MLAKRGAISCKIVAPIGERLAEVAVQRAKQPLEEPKISRLIEPEIEPHLGKRLGSGGILQNCGGEVARQDLCPDEDQDRGGEQRKDAKAETVEDELQHRRPRRPWSGLRPQGRETEQRKSARAIPGRLLDHDFSQASSMIQPLFMS